MVSSVSFVHKASKRKLAKMTDIKVFIAEKVRILKADQSTAYAYHDSHAFQRFCDFCTIKMAGHGYKNKWACIDCKDKLSD